METAGLRNEPLRKAQQTLAVGGWNGWMTGNSVESSSRVAGEGLSLGAGGAQGGTRAPARDHGVGLLLAGRHGRDVRAVAAHPARPGAPPSWLGDCCARPRLVPPPSALGPLPDSDYPVAERQPRRGANDCPVSLEDPHLLVPASELHSSMTVEQREMSDNVDIYRMGPNGERIRLLAGHLGHYCGPLGRANLAERTSGDTSNPPGRSSRVHEDAQLIVTRSARASVVAHRRDLALCDATSVVS